MDTPQLPIFLASNEDADIMVAPSLRWAEGQMEPTEVREGYYVVLDSAGRRGHLVIDRWDVKIDGWSDEADLADLRSRIARYLEEHSLVLDQTLGDSEYIQKAARLIAVENKKLNWPRLPSWLRRSH
jgi:hypothetical protein